MEYRPLIKYVLLPPPHCKSTVFNTIYHWNSLQIVSDLLGNWPNRVMIYGCPIEAAGLLHTHEWCQCIGPNPDSTDFIIITYENFNRSSSSFPYILINVQSRKIDKTWHRMPQSITLCIFLCCLALCTRTERLSRDEKQSISIVSRRGMVCESYPEAQ